MKSATKAGPKSASKRPSTKAMPLTVKRPEAPPRALGFRMPAEWEPHAATWIAWPHNKADWPGKFQPIPWIYADIVRNLSLGEKVYVFVQDAKAEAAAKRALKRSGVDLTQVSFQRRPTDRVWTRDSGPIFVRAQDGRLALNDFKFNAWAKYDDYKNDDRLPSHVAKELGLQAFRPLVTTEDGAEKRLVLEGGSIDVDGRGLLLTTEECLLSTVQQRNPGVSKDRLEAALRDSLGVEKVLWLGQGIAGDDTHGHVDDLARFVRPGTIVVASEADPADPNFEPLRDNLHRLRAMRDLGGKPFEIVELPLPAPVVFAGQRLPASYANFYIANAAVLVPVFNDPNDLPALQILAAVFPDRKVVPVYCRDLVWGLGTLHCMTQQQPQASAA